MKRALLFVAALAAPFVSMTAASADIVPSPEYRCTDADTVIDVTWPNVFDWTAHVTIRGETFDVAPHSSVTRPYAPAGDWSFTVEWDEHDGYQQHGVIVPPVAYEGCAELLPPPTSSVPVDLPPITTTTVAAPVPPPAQAPQTPAPPPPTPGPASPSADQPTLAFTGFPSAGVAAFGLVLVVAGIAGLAYEKRWKK